MKHLHCPSSQVARQAAVQSLGPLKIKKIYVLAALLVLCAHALLTHTVQPCMYMYLYILLYVDSRNHRI